MCNFFFNTLFSIHYNRCTNNERKKRDLLLRRRSLPALPRRNRQPLEKRSSSATSPAQITHSTTDDIILAVKDDDDSYIISSSHNEQVNDSKHFSQDSNNETDGTDASDDYDQFDTTDTVCGCGKILARGWVCNDCRIQCPECNRSLSTDPDDFCSRCYIKCQEHGLVIKKKDRVLVSFDDTCHLCNGDASSLVPDNTNNDSPA